MFYVAMASCKGLEALSQTFACLQNPEALARSGFMVEPGAMPLESLRDPDHPLVVADDEHASMAADICFALVGSRLLCSQA